MWEIHLCKQILLYPFWLYKYFLRSDSCLVLYLYCLCQFRTKQVSLRLSLGIFFFSACIFGVLIVLTQVPICGVVSCLNVSNVTLSRLRLGLADGVSSIWGQITGTQLGNISSGCSVHWWSLQNWETLKMSHFINQTKNTLFGFTFWMPYQSTPQISLQKLNIKDMLHSQWGVWVWIESAWNVFTTSPNL